MVKVKSGLQNPFELKFTKKKHNVLNRKVKGTRGTPGETAKSQLAHRTKTLSKSNTSNSFLDKRFGENDPTMSIDDKQMARYVAEKRKKLSTFNLHDNSSDEDELTHFGQSLSTMDDSMFNKKIESDDDENHNGMIDKHTVSAAHFGGFDDNDPDRKKSKNEIMQEIIKKSKFHKAERQRLRVENDDIMDDVDGDLDEIRGLLGAGSGKREPLPFQKTDYDTYVKELALEKRVKPSDRLKTEAEIATLEAEKLEQLERERLDRMNPSQKDTAGEKRRAPHDLDAGGVDDQVTSEDVGLQYDKDGVLVAGSFAFSKRRKLDDNGNAMGGESGDDDSAADSDDNYDSEESSQDGEQDSDLEEIVEADGAASEGPSSDEESNQMTETKQASDLPFVFPSPTSYSELVCLFENRPATDCGIILTRIRALYNVKLSPQNKDKLTTLLKLLLTHLRTTCDQPQEDLPLELINVLLAHIHPLVLQFPSHFSKYAITQITKMHDRILSLASSGKIRKYPATSALFFMQLIGRAYSTSDYKHAVVGPAILLICEILSQCPITSGKDVVKGLYLCSILLEFQGKSKRFVPEALNYLNRVVALGLSTPTVSCPGSFPIHSQDASSVLAVSSKKKGSKLVYDPLNIALLLAKGTNPHDTTHFGDSFRYTAFLSASTLLEKFSQLYSDSPSYIELFSPSQTLLLTSNLPPHEKSTSALSTIANSLATASKSRKPLRLQTRKPQPIHQYLPKFSDNFNMDKKSHDPDRERADAQKLSRQYRVEFRGAARELRKDGQFLATKRVKEVKERDAVYKKKIDGIMGGLANQEGAMRGFEKDKKKRR